MIATADLVRLHLIAVASFAETGSSAAAEHDTAGVVDAIQKAVQHLKTASYETLALLEDDGEAA